MDMLMLHLHQVVLLVKAQTLADKEAWLEALLATVTAAPLRSNVRAALAQAAGHEHEGGSRDLRGAPGLVPSDACRISADSAQHCM